MKICFKCNTEKPISDYYKHKQMKDGHLNKCKVCTKKETRLREIKITSTPEGLEKERERHRDKYRRLNYKAKQLEWDAKRPWKATQTYKNLSRKFNTSKGVELHHWNYKTKYLEDVVIMNRKEHRELHRHLVFVDKDRIFKSKDQLLDTKEKHLRFIKEKGLNYIEAV